MIIHIIKRDGRKVPFNIEKIANAIFKAAQARGGTDFNVAMDVAVEVCRLYEEQNPGKTPTVEEIQDLVEKVLIENGHAKTAKAYILYRYERTRSREMKTNLMCVLNELTFSPAKDSDIKRENANIDGDTAMGTMLKYGSVSAKEYYEMYVLEPAHAKAHREGDIHIHDLDFYTLTTTCTQIDLKKLFTNGFSTGHGFLREPNDIASYSALACIAIQSNQNDQHGGQSIVDFDYAMADGVRLTYNKYLHEAFEIQSDLMNEAEADYRSVIKYIDKLKEKQGKGCEFVCGYEAGCLGYTLQRQLAEHGVKCEILAPTTMLVSKGKRVKTDKRDAKVIAQCLAYGAYRAVYVPDTGDDAVKEYIRMRDDHRVALKKLKQQRLRQKKLQRL